VINSSSRASIAACWPARQAVATLAASEVGERVSWAHHDRVVGGQGKQGLCNERCSARLPSKQAPAAHGNSVSREQFALTAARPEDIGQVESGGVAGLQHLDGATEQGELSPR